jgi:hypothetical protein
MPSIRRGFAPGASGDEDGAARAKDGNIDSRKGSERAMPVPRRKLPPRERGARRDERCGRRGARGGGRRHRGGGRRRTWGVGRALASGGTWVLLSSCHPRGEPPRPQPEAAREQRWRRRPASGFRPAMVWRKGQCTAGVRKAGCAPGSSRSEIPFAPAGGARHGGRFRPMSDLPPDISHDQHAVRLPKLAELRAAGFRPVPRQVCHDAFFAVMRSSAYVRGPGLHRPVNVAGRLVVDPRHGQEPVREDPRSAGADPALREEGRGRRGRLRCVQEARSRRHHRG